MTIVQPTYAYYSNVPTENSYLWVQLFRLTAVRAGGFNGKVKWAGVEWNMPEDSGRSFEMHMNVGRCGFSFSPEDNVFFMTREGKVAYAEPPMHNCIGQHNDDHKHKYNDERTWQFETSPMCDMALEDGDGTMTNLNLGHFKDNHGNILMWESIGVIGGIRSIEGERI